LALAAVVCLVEGDLDFSAADPDSSDADSRESDSPSCEDSSNEDSLDLPSSELDCDVESEVDSSPSSPA
jgi:hypothetical protein